MIGFVNFSKIFSAWDLSFDCEVGFPSLLVASEALSFVEVVVHSKPGEFESCKLFRGLHFLCTKCDISSFLRTTIITVWIVSVNLAMKHFAIQGYDVPQSAEELTVHLLVKIFVLSVTLLFVQHEA